VLSANALHVITILSFIITFILPLASFLFCYSSIIFVVHRQAKIVVSQRVVNPLADTYSNTNDNRLQMNALKTMIIISVAFVICWLSCDVYTMFIFFCLDGSTTPLSYYVTLLFGFLNICVNPFIYALKYEAVKKCLFSLMGVSCYDSEPENSTSINVVSQKASR
jgi:hypothetical protein